MYSINTRQLSFVEFLMGESSETMLEEGKITQKRIKFHEIMEKVEEDGISALPDCLLLEILSRLLSTKAAVRTGTLSKRWQHLWTWVPTLIFTHSDLPQSKRLQNRNSCSYFASLVDKTLTQRRQLKLKKFEVHTYYDIQFELNYNNWIRHAMSCNVEELNLDFWATKASFLLDQSVFINSCTTDMRLSGFKLNPSGAIHWENLRSLCISWVNLDTDLLVNIFNGSPLLETLVLEYCYHPPWLSIASLINSDSDESESVPIEIINPTDSPLTHCRQLNLKKFKVYTNYDFEIQPHLNDWICYALRCNVKELDVDLLNIEPEYKFELDKIVFTSSCFTELTLNGCVLDPIGAISWKNLRSLCINYQSLDEDLIGNILCGSPVLETLELEDCYGYRRLDITSKSVKNLVLSGYDNVSYGESKADIIEINAPNILSLTIQGRFCLWKVLLVNVSSLVKAILNYTCAKIKHCELVPEEVEQEMLKGYIMNLRHVKELEIGLICSKVVSCLQAKGFVLPSNAKLTRRR